jgi:hypothetical protein
LEHNGQDMTNEISTPKDLSAHSARIPRAVQDAAE